jgi:hypothetical protein
LGFCDFKFGKNGFVEVCEFHFREFFAHLYVSPHRDGLWAFRVLFFKRVRVKGERLYMQKRLE